MHHKTNEHNPTDTILQFSTMLFSSISEVLQLLVVQDWETLRSSVLSDPTLFRNIASAIMACSQLNGMTILHAAVRYNPPLDVIAQMIRLCPHMTAAMDCLGRTPLHVAAGSGASPELIAMIAHAYPPACDVQDRDGKTPLHFACDSSCMLFEDDEGITCTKRVLNHASVYALLSYSVRAATFQDDENMSPLQHAILSQASFRTMRLIGDAMKYFNRQQIFRERPCKKARRVSIV